MDRLEEQQRLVEEKAQRRARAAEANKNDEQEKQADRDARRASADARRAAEAKRRRLETIVANKQVAEVNRQRAAREHLARVMRKGQMDATMSEVRAELEGGLGGQTAKLPQNSSLSG
ncbi:hypothetical protein PGTUg99_025319 [Puccinia graminis f. sp. tritici]|uniref:Uncharacterized protein n=1 Tax=Puccinia graminis f. sp. tritici TaxID=56615 RepID=A0A5B0R6R5_PUCGR|nr:hypothetical protein PGTUg99_025319 [Puccinia graminis f. sp. tritici]